MTPPRLLVSVRNVAEARAALDGGADIVDVKEPSNGPLGRADDATIDAIGAVVGDRAAFTAALGELHEWSDREPSVPSRPGLVKVGLAGERTGLDWGERLGVLVDGDGGEARLLARSRASEHDVPRSRWIAVAYADHVAADSPDPHEVVDWGCSTEGIAGVLFDTYDKSSGGLFRELSDDLLGPLVDRLRQRDLLSAIAGRLRAGDVPRAVAVGADVIGVRSAACTDGDRGRAIDGERVRSLREAIHAAAGSGVAAGIASTSAPRAS